ncbi:DUF4435 domain-containing protein [Leisingera sp. ANG-S5]|uniref:DUF4435 domain-containing protein n=1 Tax=Leisingera sp. ANG-S5 TaxID=1577901 RepID=UPI00057DD3C2|nr:DUF4435 domain-containing protein [Leisingera sp. ANG-S5]KIC29724.1 hypothetical protein RA25_19790 [Leisingera sp. ANG-S5]
MTSETQGIPERSAGGLAAADLFFSRFNDCNFYVEDADQENLYFEILRKIFPGIELAKIFPLGGKANVIDHARDAANNSIENRIYILDKDFDDLLEKKEDLQSVFYLDRFCIENYLLDESALIELVVETHPKKKRESIREELSLQAMIPQIGEALRELFAAFFFVQKEGLGLSNCKEKPEAFCQKGQLWKVCPALMQGYMNDITSSCEEQGVELPKDILFDDLRLEAFQASSTPEVISGKFWLSMVFHYIKSKYKLGAITFDSFVFRIAKNCSFVELESLAAEVRATHPIT